MKNILQYAFTSMWIIAVAVALYVSRNWNSTTALFPHAVAFPMLALLVAILVVDIRKGRRQKEKGGTETDEDREFPAKNRAMILYLGWLIGFAILVWAIGLVYSIPIYLFSYLTLQGKYSWLKSGIYAAAASALVFLLFQYAFGAAWPQGELLIMLGL
jgi:Ca2+/Na+ antiporter